MGQAIKERWWAYHKRNPHIYQAFERRALLIAGKRWRFGAQAIFETLRWESLVGGDEEFKINNSYTAYYVRLFEHKHPEHKGFFVKRRLKDD